MNKFNLTDAQLIEMRNDLTTEFKKELGKLTNNINDYLIHNSDNYIGLTSSPEIIEYVNSDEYDDEKAIIAFTRAMKVIE